jgi:hypothetical protein
VISEPKFAIATAERSAFHFQISCGFDEITGHVGREIEQAGWNKKTKNQEAGSIY